MNNQAIAVYEQDDINERVLFICYKLTGGSVDRELQEEEIAEEVNRLGILDMTREAFEEFRRLTVSEIQDTRKTLRPR